MYISFLLSVTFNLSESTLHVRFRASMSAKKKKYRCALLRKIENIILWVGSHEFSQIFKFDIYPWARARLTRICLLQHTRYMVVEPVLL